MSELTRALSLSRQLRLQADRLHVLVSAPADVLPRQRFADLLKHEIEETREQLLRHFATEEEGGYMASLVKDHPDLEPRARELERQHRALSSEFDEFHREIQTTPDIARLRQRIADALEAFDTHEHAERELLADARR